MRYLFKYEYECMFEICEVWLDPFVFPIENRFTQSMIGMTGGIHRYRKERKECDGH